MNEKKLYQTLLVCVSVLCLVLILLLTKDFVSNENISGLASVSLLPSSKSLTTGTQLQVDVVVNDVVNISGVQVSVGYNPKVHRFVNVSEGGFLQTQGGQTMSFPTLLNTSQPGLVKDIVIVRMNGGATGSGVIASLYFDSIATGTSAFTIPSILLVDTEGKTYSVGTINTSVKVTQPRRKK